MKRLVYNKDYYILEAIIRSDKYKRRILEFHKECYKKGAPFPLEGFEKSDAYYDWRDNLLDIGLNHKKKIDQILLDFGIKDNELYRRNLITRTFFKVSQFPLQVPIKASMNKQGSELWIKIYPFTTKEEYVEFWETIKEMKSQLPNAIEKNKKWEEFDRDYEIYLLLLKVKGRIKNGDISSKALTNKGKVSKNLIDQVMNTQEFSDLQSKYHKITPDIIEKAHRKCSRLFRNLSLI